jgi:hypothetical protein
MSRRRAPPDFAVKRTSAPAFDAQAFTMHSRKVVLLLLLADERSFLRDVRLPGGDVVRMEVNYYYRHFTAAEQRQDVAAISRVLSSAEPLPPR